MHETSLVRFTLDAVEKKCRQLGICRVESITLVIGEARGVVPELMQKAFQLLRGQDPLFRNTCLKIDLRQGRELYIDSFEAGEENDDG